MVSRSAGACDDFIGCEAAKIQRDSVNCTMVYTSENFDRIRITPHRLEFRNPARTSRSVMRHRQVYFLVASREQDGTRRSGWGEIAPLDGLSVEGVEFHRKMMELKHQWLDASELAEFQRYPSFRFAIESANLDLNQGGRRIWFDGEFVRGLSDIPINGLIWMGDKTHMRRQIQQKLEEGYPCLKLKIGGIDFDEELELLRYIRQEFSPAVLELRLDANGSFQPGDAKERLKQLSEFTIHSIEQPVMAGQRDLMAGLCELNLIPIALDEELIGLKSTAEKEGMLRHIQPQHLIFKPSLIGGLAQTREYIDLCDRMGIGWWVTSALESNVGLNVLAQFCDHLKVDRIQGLGTGKLFVNNILSPLRESRGVVSIDPQGKWGQISKP